MEQEITVAPVATGWTLKCTGVDHEIYFRGGADAEAAAHHLGTRLARAGSTVAVRIFLRDGALAGRYVHITHDLARSPDVEARPACAGDSLGAAPAAE